MSIFENFEMVDNQIVNNKWIEWYHFGIPNELGAGEKLQLFHLQYLDIVDYVQI